jgi:hypothetical protein
MRSGAMRVVAALCCLPLLAIAAPARSATPAQMWDLVRAPDWALTVRSIERLRGPLPAVDGGEPTRPVGQFAVLVFDLTNRSSGARTPRAADFLLAAAGGARFADLAEAAAARAYAIQTGLAPFGDPVPPGGTVTTLALFDIDPTAGLFTLHWLPAADHPIRIDECHCNLPSPTHPQLDG